MQTQILPYQKNTAALFEHFMHLPYAIFLDSNDKSGRYDIISADPFRVITDKQKNIFSVMKIALQKLKKQYNVQHTLPFTIGAMGYLSYDIGRTLEKIPTTAKEDIRLPKAVIGIYDWSIVVDHHEKKIFLTTAHTAIQKKILTLLKTKPCAQKKFSLARKFQSNMSKRYYQNAFQEIQKNIIAGNCYQVNLAQRFSSEFTGHPWNAYKKLRQKNAAPYSAFFNLHDGAIFSCSPERFLKVCGDIAETKPIKGTSPRFNDKIKDRLSANTLLKSEKNRAENIMIVDLLRNDLSRTCTDVTVQQLCALESFTNVHHLVSTITGKLRHQKTALDLLKNCFPGGSITGAPKIAAMKIIETLEPHRRSIYCGSIFYMDINGNMDSNILIRTVICDHHKIHCYAGGGIVSDSEWKTEYAETLIKVQKILKIFPTSRHNSIRVRATTRTRR